MNEQPPPTAEPLPAEVVDELLSAQLDGEFEAAASDLGLTPGDARTRLDATPGSAQRLVRLTEARAQIGSVEVLPEATRAELVARALASSGVDDLTARRSRRAPRDWRTWLAASGAAAALALVVAIAATLATSGGGGEGADQTATDQSRTADAERAPAVGGDSVRDLGDVTDPKALRDALEEPTATTVAGSGEATEDGGIPLTGSDDATGGQAPWAQSYDDAYGCDAATADFAVTQAPSLRAVARYEGTPAVILVYDEGDHVFVAVLAADDCRVLATQSYR